MVDNIGIPYSGINLSLSEGALISPADGEIFIALKEGHAPTRSTCAAADGCAGAFPDATFFFFAPDISTQILNFGLPAPIDVQVVGAIGNEERPMRVARTLARRCAAIPGAVDVHLQQVVEAAGAAHRRRAHDGRAVGLTEHDVASDLLVVARVERAGRAELLARPSAACSTWSSSRRRSTTIDSLDALEHDAALDGGAPPQLLSNLATISRTDGPGEHHPLQRRAGHTTSGQRRRHATSARSPTRRRADRRRLKPHLPRGTTVRIKRPGREHAVVVSRPGASGSSSPSCSSTC